MYNNLVNINLLIISTENICDISKTEKSSVLHPKNKPMSSTCYKAQYLFHLL